MKKITKRMIAILLVVTMMCTISACGGSDECSMCGGTGYYQKKDCPACP